MSYNGSNLLPVSRKSIRSGRWNAAVLRCGLSSKVKSSQNRSEERLSVWVEIWTSWPVATWFWTPDIIPVQVRQAAGDVLAVQVIPERRREATCKLSAYHSEGQKRVATVRISLGRGRGRCGLSADSGRPCPEVPRSVAVSGDAPSMRGEAMIVIWEQNRLRC